MIINSEYNRDILYGECIDDLNSLYNNNIFNIIFPNISFEHNKYLCPICLKFYYYNKEYVTDEHVPLKCLRGNKLVLTCSKCNCGFGGLDDSLLKLINYNELINETNNYKKSIPFYIKDKLAKSKIKSSIDYQSNKIYYNEKIFYKTINNLKKIDNLNHNKILEYCNNNIVIELIKPDESKYFYSLLKFAYLICFKFFKYKMFELYGFKLIQNILNNKKFIENYILYFCLNNIKFNYDCEGISLIYDINNNNLLLVSFKIRNKMYFVLIPIFNEYNFEIKNNEIKCDWKIIPYIIKINNNYCINDNLINLT